MCKIFIMSISRTRITAQLTQPTKQPYSAPITHFILLHLV